MPTTIYTNLDEVVDLVDPELQSEARATFERWLDRADGVALYENHDLGHPELGHRQFLSFGSEAAQLPYEEAPAMLPDIGTRINWRYALVGTYRPHETALALTLEACYARHADQLDTYERATFANAIKLLRTLAHDRETRP